LPHSRSVIDHIQLVLLAREADFKEFGHDKFFSPLIDDLCDIEDNGIELFTNVTVRGTIVAIVGDNLGSHCIGGFSENFSTVNYVCRYCMINKQTVKSTCHAVGQLRTVSNYDTSAANAECSNGNETYGIKFSSVFNKLKYFHVCQPGLPPCLGHDLFEGVVARDVALYIRYFVKNMHYFTYEQLNRLVARFKYVGADADNKPCVVKADSDRLSGHAVQNWYFVRLMPLFIADRISDKANPVWRVFLLLRSVVELVCAPSISENQVAWLKQMIQDYLQQRAELFPDIPMTPKHHYLTHYGDLILCFGPLIRVWTLRFESKHSFFQIMC
jgi:hypothetical protein